MNFRYQIALYIGNITGYLINKISKYTSLYVPFKYKLLERLFSPQITKLSFNKKNYIIKFNALSEKGFWRMKCINKKHKKLNYLISKLTKDDIFWDVGANIGQISLFAGLVSEAYTYSFEIEPFTFSMLVDNVNKNNLNKSITTLPIGLGKQNNLQPIFIDNDPYTNSARNCLYDKNIYEDNLPKLIVMKGDDVLEKFNCKLPTFLKIDVDGPELDVLIGMKKILSNEKLKNIVVECILSGDSENYKPIKEYLSKFNFKENYEFSNSKSNIQNIHFIRI
ncbi:FkbM family methyltransferase [uncultured Prochlorococcus sp.]|uniref:FkbM family methyltransferase n=1 Tax=uncultured Prochlorococcus sp. TaxID=159733 RepID=UPI002582D8C2|nr:FkbM family methyltransferase [uncultured Prochlorococcus sp.]